MVASTQKQNKQQPPLLVYDYAMGGDAVRGLAIQARKISLPGLASKPAAAPWTADDTLFGARAASLLGHLPLDDHVSSLLGGHKRLRVSPSRFGAGIHLTRTLAPSLRA